MNDFDELYVVSDLHLGGEEDFQIFDRGDALAGLIDFLAARRKDSRVVLVLNGDIVDFLAEPGSKYLDPEGAVDKLKRIRRDPAFARVWQRLAAFVRAPNRRLVLVLGNHDVELALPPVRGHLAEVLCGQDDGARGRLIFAVDGTGYACTVGGARVLCLHGNEADGSNVVDYERLLEIAQSINRGAIQPGWVPNFGTRLVIDVMNDVKRTYRWVDLLKPEGTGVIPLILALDPNRLTLIRRFLEYVATAAGDRIGRAVGLLGGTPDVVADPDGQLLGILGDTFEAADGGGGTTDPKRLLLSVEVGFRRGEDGFASVATGDEMLGWQDVLGKLRGLNKADAVRAALKKLVASFGGFDPTKCDKTLSKLENQVSSDIDFVIAGHTHMAKALPRQRGGFYFNSGTWIRLIQLPDWLLDNSASFAPAWEALQNGSMAALDSCQVTQDDGEVVPLVRRLPHVVSIARTGTQVSGALQPVDIESGIPGKPVRDPFIVPSRNG
jgi:UDP-2,3-diacylglucosamine pyrophosphatase LpxH